jgi:hypothetical protein
MNALDYLRTFFSKDGPVRYESNLEGQDVRDGVLYLGDRAGPGRSQSDLAHEMSHFVEIDDDRMLVRGWGLVFPQVEICGQLCDEPKTLKMTERELRVMAYQANLLTAAGAQVSTSKLVKALVFVPDFHLVPMEDGRPGHLAKDVPYQDREPSRLRWLKNRVEELRVVHTLERFRHEWNRKVRLLAT